jgi:hypothetical protein
MSEGSYLVRYVCTSKNNESEKENMTWVKSSSNGNKQL